MKLIIYGLVIYLLYKVIFEVVVPVSNGVKTVKRNMEQMQRQQAEAFRQAQNRGGQTQQTNTGHTSATTSAAKKEAPVEAEYIDFEEVKKK
jgi:Sec-independent protein translocase protein TatA